MVEQSEQKPDKNGAASEHEHQRQVPAIKRAQKCRVKMLDGTELELTVDRNCTGKQMFEMVAAQINLNEKDYFSLTYLDKEKKKNWIYGDKRVGKQVQGRSWELSFEVKFYPPEPSALAEDLTRYLLCLQVQRDVVSGKLPTSFATQALLGSYMVQAHAGDYDPQTHGAPEAYLSDFCFAPRPENKLLDKVHELHKTHKGQTPAEAEMHYLENAKKLTMYGVDIHPAKDSNNTDILLGVCSSGLLVYQDQIRINRFAWPKIIKIAFRGRHFKVKIRPGEFEKYATDIWFKLSNYRAAKRLWKACVEHHTFFRLIQPEEKPKSGLFRLGSTRFRYSGRTQFQSRMASQMVERPVPVVQRSQSARFSSQSMEKMPPPAQEQKQAVELAAPLHYMDSGSRDALGQKSPSTPREEDEERKEVSSPEKSPTRDVVAVVPVRERKSSSSSSSSSQASAGKTKVALVGAVERSRSKSSSSKEGEKDVSRDEEREKKSPKRVAIAAPETKEEKKRRKEEEKENKKREKEEKERKKKEERERKRREKEEQKKKKKKGPEVTAVVVGAEKRQKRDSESSSSSSGKSTDDEGKKKDKSKKKEDKVKTVDVSLVAAGAEKRKKRPSESSTSSSNSSDAEKKGKSKKKAKKGKKPVPVAVPVVPDEPVREEVLILEKENLQPVAESSQGMDGVVVLPESQDVSGPQSNTVERRWEETSEGPVQVTTETLEDGTVVTRRTQMQTTKQTVQRQTVQHYEVHSMEDGSELPPEVHASRQVYSPAGEVQVPSSIEAPVLETTTRTVAYEAAAGAPEPLDAEFVSSRTVSSGNRTVETVTYKAERDGVVETHVEHKIMIHTSDDLDHDAELSAAIMEATKMNPDMTVEKIEVKQETQC